MRKPYNSRKEIKFWDKRGYLTSVENGQWDRLLPLNRNGELVLNRDSTIEMALLHSRDYQNQVDARYAAALNLAINQFEFDINCFVGSDTDFQAYSDGLNALRNLTVANRLGGTRNLAAVGRSAPPLISWFSGRETALTFWGPTVAVIVAMTNGLVFGIYPARRAAALAPSKR